MYETVRLSDLDLGINLVITSNATREASFNRRIEIIICGVTAFRFDVTI